jgi:NADH-quinone oxidoreductase subunit H
MAVIVEILKYVLTPPVLAPLVYPGLATALATVLIIIWLERKLTARVQMRVGPYYVARWLHGALQLVADGTRFFFQEVIVPVTASRGFLLAPALALSLIVVALAVIPGGPGVVGFSTPYSLLVALTAVSLAPPLILLMGWSSNNKFTILGSAREALLTASYEPLLFISALAMAVLYGSLDLHLMVVAQMQLGVPGILLNPLAALLFFIAMAAATDRIPFDIVMGEQEIVHGPYTEYSGIAYGLVMGLDYVKLYTLSLVFTHLFLAGWLPATSVLAGSLVVYAKTFLVMVVAVFLRSVYGRLRLDHALDLMWSKLLPLALASLVLSALLSYIVR